MTKYREILRLTSLGISQRDIMKSLGIAQKTVVKVLRRAKELALTWPLDNTYTDAKLERIMFGLSIRSSSVTPPSAANSS